MILCPQLRFESQKYELKQFWGEGEDVHQVSSIEFDSIEFVDMSSLVHTSRSPVTCELSIMAKSNEGMDICLWLHLVTSNTSNLMNNK